MAVGWPSNPRKRDLYRLLNRDPRASKGLRGRLLLLAGSFANFRARKIQTRHGRFTRNDRPGITSCKISWVNELADWRLVAGSLLIVGGILVVNLKRRPQSVPATTTTTAAAD